MKKIFRKLRKGSPSRSGEASPKSGSTRGSVASLNIGYEVKEKDLGKLHKAAWIGDLNKVKQLAKKDPSPLDKENRTPLHLACVQGNEQIVQVLLEWKAKTNIGDNQSRTPLMRAVEFQQEGCVALLLSYRVDVDSSDSQGNAPLHLAVGGGNLNIVNQLIRAGASLNTKNKEGLSPLHIAVRHKMDEVCRLLLKERADVNVEDTNLRTPLMYACQDGSVSLVKLLLEYHADTVHKDSKGWSADDCAVIPGHHACSQLITDYNHRMNRTTPTSTPRSSLPPSVANTPRDKDSIGMPVADGGGDDSDNETISRASGGPDSWADSPEVSVTDEKKGKEELWEEEEDDVFDEKAAGGKLNIAKFAHKIHISESDTDGDSSRGPTPKKKIIPAAVKDDDDEDDDEDDDDKLDGGIAAGSPVKNPPMSNRQTSWQSSVEENSWGDSSPKLQRKNSAQRVSFKRDEELSEIHDITVTESEAESDIHEPTEKVKVGPSTSTPSKPQVSGLGYVPSANQSGSLTTPSQAKMRGDSENPALMEELGLSDVDDNSEADSSPALPATPPPKAPAKLADDDWDTSAISDIMTTPRPGILKKSINVELQGSSSKVDQARRTPPTTQAKPFYNVPAGDSGDESSAWDTTEAENLLPDEATTPIKPSKVAPVAAPVPAQSPQRQPQPQQRDSVSEWDSDIEDMIVPDASKVVASPTPPLPHPGDTIPKEVEAIVRQKQAECPDSEEEEEDSLSQKGVGSIPASPLVSDIVEQSAKFFVNGKGDDEEDDWDSTTEAVTPRGNAGLQFKEVNVGAGASLANDDDMPPPPPLPTVPAPVLLKAAALDKDDDEETESAWDSDPGDVIPQDFGPPQFGEHPPPYSNPVHALVPTAITTPRDKTGGPELQGKVIVQDQSDSDEETETMGSWQQEIKAEQLLQQNAVKATDFDDDDDDGDDDEEITPTVRAQAQLQAQMIEQQRHEEERKEEERKRMEERRKKEEEERRRMEEVEREKERKEKEEKERQERQKKEKEEEERRKQLQREEEERQQQQRLKWEREEAQRQEELKRQWEREEEQRQEQLRQEAEEIKQREEEERQEAVKESTVVARTRENNFQAQQELQRVDEQYQREKKEKEFWEDEKVISPVSSPPPPVAAKPSSVTRSMGPSSGTGVYVNIGSSTVDQIKQRLQVPPPSQTTFSPTLAQTGLSSTGSFSPDGFDDNDSLTSDNLGDERHSSKLTYSNILAGGAGSLYRPNAPLDDDALSYTSTEFEDNVQSTPGYGRDREVLANVSINDPSSLLKVQDYVRDLRRQTEQERNYRVVLENQLKVANKEKAEVSKKFEQLSQQRAELEQNKLDLEAKIRSLEYTKTEEEEKRKNAEILLSKTKEQLARKEEQYASELESKQRAELSMRNLQIEMRSTANTIKELEEEKEELQRQVTHANNARMLQEQINDDQHKFIQQQQQQQSTPRDIETDLSPELSGESDKLRAELYALKMEMDRQRSRFKDEVTLMGAENEELISKNEELRNDIKLNEEALAHATMQYNIQVSALRTELGSWQSATDKEKAAREKLEAEIESMKTRLHGANQELDKAVRARNELEREYRRDRDTWAREMERKDEENSMLKENAQHLNQRLHATDAKLNSMESELHVSNTSLMERTTQLQQLKQDLERQKTAQDNLEQNYRLEKEQQVKLQAKVENMQDKLSQQQHENLSLRQQMDSLKLSSGGLPNSEANEKLNNILTNLRADSDRARASLEERNNSLVEQVARLKEEVRSSENRRATLEQDLRRLHEEHSDMVKKLSHAEVTLQMTLRTKEQLEQERAQMRVEIEKLQQRYQTTHDKAVEAQARVAELIERLEKAENSNLYSSQQLANTSATMQAFTKSKSELDESMQQLQVDNARLEAELKYEKQRADMLYQDLQDSQKVRSSLEVLCANLKSNTSQLEGKLGSEIGSEDSRLDIADLERVKQSSESQLGQEKSRANMANEERRTLESRLEQEMEKNQQLQKDVNTLKLHLKSAKNKMKVGGSPRHDPPYTEFRKDVDNMATHVSTPRIQAQMSGPEGDLRTELEAKYRWELNRKLDDVNRFLESQSAMRDRLDTSRGDLEANLMADKRKLEEENNNLRVKYEQAIAQRETKEMEAKRFRELYETEMNWRMRVSDQLQLANDRGLGLKSKLNNERLHRTRLTNSIGNMNNSIVSNTSFDLGRLHVDSEDLNGKIKAELDRSIAKHLEAAPHDHNKPLLRPTKDVSRFTSCLTQSNKDYIEILKRKYCV